MLYEIDPKFGSAKVSSELYLVEVGKIGNLVPQVPHHLLVLLELGVFPFSLSFDDGVADGQALEVVPVQDAVVVNVVHVPDDEFDAVVP